uniref:Ribosomal protein S24 n=1 Tax=Panagrolaimus superbus TaxID=310955 RepID=A0A914XYJ2_9BILA
MNITTALANTSSRLYACTSQISQRSITTTIPLCKNRAGKHRATIDRTRLLTYEMSQKPHHIGVRKAWLSWHSQNLEEFRQSQPIVLAQDEVIRRFIRGFFPQNITINGTELVIKRRGNVVYVTGFLQHSKRLDIRRIYWMFGFAEEFLSLLLKQPVKLELQFVTNETVLAYNYI